MKMKWILGTKIEITTSDYYYISPVFNTTPGKEFELCRLTTYCRFKS